VFDGVSFFRRAFLDGGIQRCFTDDMLQNNTHPTSLNEIENEKYLKRIKKEKINTSDFSEADIVDDLKRLVATYYLYNGMIPIVDAYKELSILISPLEIGGRIWACAGYFTQIPVREISDYGIINIEAQEQTFLQNYHIYNDIDERLKKELRHSIIDCYYDLLAYYYAECFKDHNITCILDEQKENESLTETCVRWINTRYAAITMYLPFDAISVAIKEGRHAPNAKYDDRENGANITGIVSENQKIYTGAYLTEEYGCVIDSDSNLFFADVPAGTLPDGKSVVNIRDVQVKLSNAILLSYASQTPIKHSDQEQLRVQKHV
jgi:hypothetical protein